MPKQQQSLEQRLASLKAQYEANLEHRSALRSESAEVKDLKISFLDNLISFTPPPAGYTPMEQLVDRLGQIKAKLFLLDNNIEMTNSRINIDTPAGPTEIKRASGFIKLIQAIVRLGRTNPAEHFDDVLEETKNALIAERDLLKTSLTNYNREQIAASPTLGRLNFPEEEADHASVMRDLKSPTAKLAGIDISSEAEDSTIDAEITRFANGQAAVEKFIHDTPPQKLIGLVEKEIRTQIIKDGITPREKTLSLVWKKEDNHFFAEITYNAHAIAQNIDGEIQTQELSKKGNLTTVREDEEGRPQYSADAAPILSASMRIDLNVNAAGKMQPVVSSFNVANFASELRRPEEAKLTTKVPSPPPEEEERSAPEP